MPNLRLQRHHALILARLFTPHLIQRNRSSLQLLHLQPCLRPVRQPKKALMQRPLLRPKNPKFFYSLQKPTRDGVGFFVVASDSWI